jgi:cytidylate kinase
MAVVTISREYGSGSSEIVARVCRALWYRYFDKLVMTRAAVESGLQAHEVVDFSEDSYKVQGFLDRLFSWRGPRVVAQIGTWTEDAAGARVREVETLDEAQSVAMVKATILAVYKQDNMIIVGRGGQVILRDKPNVLHVRLIANLKARVQRLHERDDLSLAKAQELALNHDRASAEYLKRFYDIDWADPLLYDLVINTTRLGIGGAVQLIIGAVNQLPAAASTQ